MPGTATATVPAAQLDRDNPWPGLESFQENARDYFHGREAEADEMLRRVTGAPLTVLFGKSGLGKTSLLKAGLFPRLRDKHFLPVHVRLDVRMEAPELADQLRDALLAEIERERIDAPPLAAGETLWEYLHRADLELWSGQNHLLTPVFVLDQFEEVFTLGERLPEAVAQCKIDLGDLAENRIPAALADRLAADASTAQRLDLRRMAYKLVVTLREDFLPHLEGWRAAVPSLGRVRVRLLPMRPEQALSAVYDAAPHLMDEPLARRIVEFVAAAQGDGTSQEISAGGEIEPALLSLFCRGLNEQRKRQGKDRFDEQLLEGARQSIIADYYRSCVEGLPDSVSRFIETDLLTEKGFRNSYAKDDAVPSFLTQEQLDRLIDRRLLRVEERYGTARIELTHDLLTRAVMAHRDRRRAEEERQELEAQARTQRRRVLVMAVVAVVCLAFAGIAAWQWRKALDAQRSALSAKLASDSRAQRERELDLSFLLGAAAWSVEPTLEARNVLLSNLLAQPVRGMLPSRSAVRAAVFSPDGRTLAATEDNTVILWDVARHTRLGRPFAGHEGPVWSIAFSHDGKILASGSMNGTVFLWDVARHTTLGKPLVGDQAKITSVAFSPDGKILASGSNDGTVILWDVARHTALDDPLFGDQIEITSVAFSPDGKILVSGGNGDDNLILWDVASHKPIDAPLIESPVWVNSVAFSHDGKTLASGGGGAGPLMLWDVASRTAIGEPQYAQTNVSSVAFRPDGATLALATDAGVILWDTAEGIEHSEPLVGSKGVIWSVAFSPDGQTLASGGEDGTVILWGSTDLGERLVGPRGAILSVAFSRDGKTLALGGEDGTITLWDIAGSTAIGKPLVGPKEEVCSVAFSPDGKILASGGENGTVMLWDLADRKLLGVPLTGHQREVYNVVFSPDGKTLASGSWDGAVILWDVAHRRRLGRPLAGHKRQFSVAFSPDGRTLAAGSDGDFILWDVSSHKPVGKPLTGPKNWISFSPDGKTLASVGEGGETIHLWDVMGRSALGKLVVEERLEHVSPASSIAFSPDGTTLASGGADGRVILWDVRRMRLGETLTGPIGLVIGTVSFSPDGKILVSGDTGGGRILWDLDPDSWSRRACLITSRNLTCDEWRLYLLDEPYRKLCPEFPGPERCDAQQPS